MKILLECFAEDVTETKCLGSAEPLSPERAARLKGSVSSGLGTSCSRHASA